MSNSDDLTAKKDQISGIKNVKTPIYPSKYICRKQKNYRVALRQTKRFF
jgi:hypothetical protein